MASDALRNQVATKWQESFNRLNRGSPGISGLMLFSEQAWTVASAFLYPRDLGEPPKDFNNQKIRTAFDVLMQCRMLPMLLESFVEDMRKRQHLITRDVEEYMAQYEATNSPSTIASLILRLADWYATWAPGGELGHTISAAFVTAFQTHIFSVLPPAFAGGFKRLIASTLELSTEAQDSRLWTAFEVLGLADRYEALIASVCYEHIEEHVLATCKGKWDEPMLPTLREWMADNVLPWMLLPYARGAKTTDEAKTMLQGVGSRFDFHVCKTLCDLRTQEVFDIVIDYPDSTPALQDLKECLQRVDQRAQLVQAIRKANKRRLLHPGADTKDILTQYVSIIRCLRIIDPPGVLLFKVADPIRRYLRERPDTIRSIVASLVADSESGDSLVDENEPIQPLSVAQIDDYMDPNWEPEPIDAGPEFRTNKPSDVISTLVSIYDSKDLFIKELQVLLAQRLLAVTDGDYEKERRNIEILKIRFGEAPLQVCEVMLRDMTDSRRIDQHVKTQQPSILHPTIISRHFWPQLQSSKIVMPGQLRSIQESYSKEYTLFKPDKKLRWLSHLGTVNLDIQLQDRTITADVPPLEAAFIELFSEKDSWSVEELISRVGAVERGVAVKALLTWVDLGVLKEEEGHTFRLLETADSSGGLRPSGSRTIIDEQPTVVTVQQQQAEQMRVYWKFIEGMLTNLGSLPLDRIQTMLKFAQGYDRTVDQLAGFMEAARREGLVTVREGLWRLNRG
ncbi:ubiquitin-protein ligase [Auriscalpium vulgare]|uniref:Ubiquitin-protein ligase n=1 Tax=Auriscalpium vulgare TaxID=40419 RepID=A0ACB8RLU7_9AGAM|nr:ubiquitin-protein ligase [Auriscalpium vulgare]